MLSRVPVKQWRPQARILASTLVVLAGCNVPQDRLAQFNRLYEQGDLVGAGQYAQKRITPRLTPGGEDLLWALQLGTVERARKNYTQSNLWFDRAEEMMKYFETDVHALDMVGATVVNANVIPYRGHTYDAIMVNTYKAMNFIASGRDDLARVEFNRAADRQMRAKELFNREIQRLKQRMDKDKNAGAVNYNKTLADPNVTARIRQQNPSLYDFRAYPDFVNPWATYLGGVFFLMIEDPAKAADFLKETAGMVPENKTVAMDYEAVQQWLDRGRRLEPSVWVVYEDGLGPVKEEYRIDLPLFMVSNEILYTGVALPRLVNRAPASDHLEVNTAGTWAPTQTVADMDRVIQTEFAKEFPGILMRALISAAAKAVAQHALLDQGGSGGQFLGLMMAAYTAATTVADVRMWTGLPKDFQVVRVPMPANGRLEVRTTPDRTIEIALSPCRYALVHVRMTTRSGGPVWEVVTRGPAASAAGGVPGGPGGYPRPIP